jgi:multicomponent Na+:H+ antiporter subunit B
MISSFYLFLRGHNLPGGGFIGGLVLSLALILYILSSKSSRLDLFFKTYFTSLIAFNLFGLVLVLFLPVFFHQTILTGLWTSIPLPIAGKLSSILFFDLFIYLLVAICTTRAYLEFTNFSGQGRF